MSELDSMLPATRSRQFLAAWWRGVEAYREGKPLWSCPYGDTRSVKGHVTFARAYQRYWKKGWRAAAKVERGKIS